MRGSNFVGWFGLYLYIEDICALLTYLSSTLRMNPFWKAQTQMRIIVLVDRDRDVDEETKRWEKYMRHVR